MLFIHPLRNLFIFRNYVSLAFNCYGSNSKTIPLVIAHGLFGQKKNWNSLAKALQTRLNNQVYTLDLRNHGDSPHINIHTYQSMADDIHAFINNIVLKNSDSVILIGDFDFVI